MWGILQPFLPFLEIDKVRKDSIIAIFQYKFMAILLITSSVLITSRIIFGEPIVCWGSPLSISESVTNSFCYMSGTSTMLNHVKREHIYYQFMPILLVIMSLGYYIPRGFWVLSENGLFVEILQDLQSNILDAEKKGEQLKKLSKFVINKKGEHFKLFGCHVLSIILYTCNIIAQFFNINLILSGDFLSYGVLRNLNEVFPKVTDCDITHIGYTGHEDLSSLTCFLPINTFNDKLFLVIWYLMVVSGILLLFNLLYTFVYIICPPFRYFILRQKVGKKVTYDQVQKAVGGLGTCSDVSECFVLQVISQNLSEETASELFNMI